MILFRILKHLFIFVLLTVFTQVGGVIWILAVLISFRKKIKKRFVFPLLYLVFNLLIIPPIAKQFGRVSLPVFDDELKPRNWVFPLLFRNYVNSNLKTELENSAHSLSALGISITYLDANFPFLDGFPLLPHLSHNDGKKIDLSFMYIDKNGKSTNKKPSTSGYGVYAYPKNNYTSKSCISQGYWQYDFTKYITFGTINDLELDKLKTRILIQQLLSNSLTQKIFIEPHLKQSLRFSKEEKIRFHGCKAVRHDDHIHLEIK